MRPINLHFPVKPVVKKEVVGHSHPVGLHGVTLAIVVVAYVTVIVVAHFGLTMCLHFPILEDSAHKFTKDIYLITFS